MKPSVQRVHEALVAHGVESTIVELSQSTRTASEAAAALGTTVGQIVKSLVFISDRGPLIVLVSGGNRVDVEKLGHDVSGDVRRATAEEVRATTGFAIGGVPPVGFSAGVQVLVDPDLLIHDRVWAAAGTPNSVFPIAPDVLVRITSGRLADVKEVG